MDGWFPRLNSRGQVASGSGSLWVDDIEVFKPGWQPQWLNDDTLVFKGAADKPYSLHLPTGKVTLLANKAVTYVVGGGNVWHIPDPGEIGASVDPRNGSVATCVEHGGSNFDRSIVWAGRPIIEHKAVQFPSAQDGLLTWILWTGQTATDREPWGVAVTGVAGRLRVFTQSWEGSPFPFQTPEGPWLLTQTNWDLRLRPWGSKTGYIINTGEDRNFNPHVRWIGTKIVVVCNDGSGKLSRFELSLTQPRVDVSKPVTTTPPPPDEDIMFPEKLKDGQNVHAFVSRELKATGLLGKGETAQERRDNAARAIAKVAMKANQIEGREDYGLRSKHREAWTIFQLKAGGQIGVYSDLLAYRNPFSSADVVTSAELPSAGTGWTNESLVTDDRHRFVKPSELKLEGVPVPEPQTHMYIGGGNDTGTCDECGRSRFDPVHAIPESKIPHGYDGGEQDTGLCDICQKPVTDPIHTGVEPPPGDCQQWIDEVVRLQNENNDLREEIMRLEAEIKRLEDELANQPPPGPCECVINGPAWAIRLLGITCTPK